MKRRIYLGCSALAVLLVLKVAVIPASGQSFCGECTEKALHNHGEGTIALLKKEWSDYRLAAEVYKTAQERGTDKQKALAQEIWERAQIRWRFVERMAKDYAAPAFVSYLDRRHADLSNHLQKAKEGFHREAELYKRLENSLGRQRQAAISDITSFEKESNDLKHEFYADLGVAAISGVAHIGSEVLKETIVHAGAIAEGGNASQSASALVDFLKSVQIQGFMVEATVRQIGHGLELQKAMEEHNNLKSFASVVHSVSDASLTFIDGLVKAGAVKVGHVFEVGAADGLMYLHIVALALDNVEIAESFHHLGQAEQRLDSVGVTESGWQHRVQVAGAEVARIEQRLKLLDTEMAYQKRIADFYRQTQGGQLGGTAQGTKPHLEQATLRFLSTVSPVVYASKVDTQPPEDHAASYVVFWLDAAAALIQLSAHTGLNLEHPDANDVLELRKATDRLENAVSAMLKVVPREDSTMAHASVLPCLIEAVGAARESLHFLDDGRPAEAEATIEWLQQAIFQVREALMSTGNVSVTTK